MPKKMSSASSFGSMVKGWAELALLEHPCAGLWGTCLCPVVAGPQGQRRWAGVRLPSNHGVPDYYLQGFLKSQDVSSSQNWH